MTGPTKEPCPGCSGAGVQHNTQTGLKVVCPVCHGSGTWIRPQPDGMPHVWCGHQIMPSYPALPEMTPLGLRNPCIEVMPFGVIMDFPEPFRVNC